MNFLYDSFMRYHLRKFFDSCRHMQSWQFLVEIFCKFRKLDVTIQFWLANNNEREFTLRWINFNWALDKCLEMYNFVETFSNSYQFMDDFLERKLNGFLISLLKDIFTFILRDKERWRCNVVNAGDLWDDENIVNNSAILFAICYRIIKYCPFPRDSSCHKYLT